MYIEENVGRLCIAVIGLPRSGTTIVCRFLNSIDGASLWGEPHRASHSHQVQSMYGDALLPPGVGKPLDHIERFAKDNGLNIFGFKEPWDINGPENPIAIVDGYGDRIDLVLAMFRNPRKNYASMLALGHMEYWDAQAFCEGYRQMWEYYISTTKARAVVLERFVEDPIGYMSSVLDKRIAGSLKLKSFTGGGDPYATRAESIQPDARVPYHGNDIGPAIQIYNRFGVSYA